MAALLIKKAAFFIIAAIVVALLPASPFTAFSSIIQQLPFIGYVNYFIPIGTILSIMEAWLAAITVYYIYMLVLRMIKLE